MNAKEITETEKVQIDQAAREIGCCKQFLRQQMRRGEWDLGAIVRPEKKGSSYRYYVFRRKLDAFLGKDLGKEAS